MPSKVLTLTFLKPNLHRGVEYFCKKMQKVQKKVDRNIKITIAQFPTKLLLPKQAIERPNHGIFFFHIGKIVSIKMSRNKGLLKVIKQLLLSLLIATKPKINLKQVFLLGCPSCQIR